MKYLILFFFSFNLIQLNGQKSMKILKTINKDYFLVKKNNKYGIIDKNKKIVLKIEYDRIDDMQDGTYYVYSDSIKIYLDNTFKILVKDYRRDNNKPFNNRIIISKNGKYGYADINGKTIIPCIYSSVEDFYKGIARVSKETYGSISVIDTNGRTIIPFGYEFVSLPRHDEDMEYIIVQDGKYTDSTKKYIGHSALFNMKGIKVIDFKYARIKRSTQGVFIACILNTDKWIYINQNDSIICSDTFNEANSFEKGMAVVYKKDKCTYLNSDFKYISDFKFKQCNDFYNSENAVVYADNKYGVVDTKGNLIIPIMYDHCNMYSFSNNKLYVTLNGESFAIDKNNNRLK